MTTYDIGRDEAQMTFAVRVNQDYCISSGKCVADEPTVFQFNEEEVAEPTGSTDGVDRARLVEAVHNCPAGAISLLDSAGNVIEQ